MVYEKLSDELEMRLQHLQKIAGEILDKQDNPAPEDNQVFAHMAPKQTRSRSRSPPPTALPSSLVVHGPSQALLDLAEQFCVLDFGATFSNDVVIDATKNVTIKQAMPLFKNLSTKYQEMGGHYKQLGDAIKSAAQPMVMPLGNGQLGINPETTELCSFFSMTPDDFQSVCTVDALDLPEQQKQVFRDFQAVDNYRTEDCMMLLLIRRDGKNLQLIDTYHAMITSEQTSIWQWAASGTCKRQRLKALKVRAQAVLAEALSSKYQLPLVLVEDSEDLQDLKA